MQAMAAESVPDIEPKTAVVTTVTAPRPLLKRPKIRLIKSISRLASPVASSIVPNSIKRGTANRITESTFL